MESDAAYTFERNKNQITIYYDMPIIVWTLDSDCFRTKFGGACPDDCLRHNWGRGRFRKGAAKISSMLASLKWRSPRFTFPTKVSIMFRITMVNFDESASTSEGSVL